MGRGVKKTASYQIAEIDAKIQKKQDEIKTLHMSAALNTWGRTS